MRGITALIILFFIFTSASSFAAQYLELTLNDGSKVSGELVETYEDRWFYQAPGPHVAKFMLLFEVIDDEPIFHFHSLSEIEHQKTVKESASQYKAYLKKEDLFFKNFVVPGAHILTGNEGHHKFEKMYGNFAWDLGVIDPFGKQFQHDGSENEHYYIFNADIMTPLDGVVVGKVDGQPDNPPDLTFTSSLAGKINNYLTIQVAPKFYLSLVHFKKNTINVEVGDRVTADQVLGQVGNSGVSYLPHLHFTLYTYIAKEDRFISVPGFVLEDELENEQEENEKEKK